MKFSQIQYERPDFDAIRKTTAEIVDRIKNAGNADEQIAAYDEFEQLKNDAASANTVCYIRHSINTKDEFYDRENDFFDENSPLFTQLINDVNNALLASPFKAELEQHYGSLLFKNFEIEVRTFKPEITQLMQEENRLQSEYQKLYASLTAEWNGETIPLPKLGLYKQSSDRETRKRAYITEGEVFDSVSAKMDEIYAKLVRCRNAQARALGHENYIQLGYDRLGRNCYGYNELKEYRAQIADDVVPVVAKVKKMQEKRIGVDKLKFYDDIFCFTDGNAKPHGTADEILAAGKEMYHSLSRETAEFIDFMYDSELLDVESKDGKAPGGYCTDMPKYKAPFIFSNFNGTSADVDVLTHEAGHAFAAYRAYKHGYISNYISPTIEACEVHSMSMEFMTAAYHKLFFKEETKKYEFSHCAESFTFIPYGCMVDEFQHIMYENEDMTPQQRHEEWLKLESRYRPYIDFDDIPFYSRGAGWQRQLHIFLYPLYYIDYCMAQTMAFQFWLASLDNFDEALKKYLAFVDLAGTKTFEELVHSAGMRLPYDKGCMSYIAKRIGDWLDSHSEI